MPEVRWVPLAEVARPHGVWGEVRLKVYNSDSELLLDQSRVMVRRAKGKEAMMDLESIRGAAQGILLAKFRGVDTRDAADELRSAVVCVERSEFPELEPGEFYVCDIIGARLVGPNGDVGVVQDFVSYPTADVLVASLDTPGGAKRIIEVPLVEDFVENVDAAESRIVLRAAAIEWLGQQVSGAKSHAD